MIDDNEDNENNIQDDLNNNHDIKLNENRKKILPNINQGNNNDSYNSNQLNQDNDEYIQNQNNNGFNQNGDFGDLNNEMKQPGTNFYYNQERNVTEEISDKTMGHLNKCLENVGKYFNVELHDLKLKLKGSIIPFNKSFYQSILINADLYGPFWTFTTIIFLIALIGNFNSYIHEENKENYIYDYTHVPHAIFIIYGFGFGAPLILWIISRFVFKIDIDLITIMCVYGYSYTILIPILLICIIPFKFIATLALLYFLIHSCTFLFYNLYLMIQEKAPKAKYIVLGLLGGVQFLLFLLLKFYFF